MQRVHYRQRCGAYRYGVYRPDRASRDDNRAKYTPEQSQIFMCRQAAQTRKKSA
ncbi:MAG: phage polarity suppression protein [Hafnia sp.]